MILRAKSTAQILHLIITQDFLDIPLDELISLDCERLLETTEIIHIKEIPHA